MILASVVPLGFVQVDGATLADVGLLVPELILVVTAIGLLLAARWIQRTQVAVLATVLATVAAAVAAMLSPAGGEPGFGGMLTVDGYARFFKVLMAAALGLAALLSVNFSRNT